MMIHQTLVNAVLPPHLKIPNPELQFDIDAQHDEPTSRSESVTWYILQDLQPQITLTIDIAEDQSAAAHMKD
jgi:hypothetical protein